MFIFQTVKTPVESEFLGLAPVVNLDTVGGLYPPDVRAEQLVSLHVFRIRIADERQAVLAGVVTQAFGLLQIVQPGLVLRGDLLSLPTGDQVNLSGSPVAQQRPNFDGHLDSKHRYREALERQRVIGHADVRP